MDARSTTLRMFGLGVGLAVGVGLMAGASDVTRGPDREPPGHSRTVTAGKGHGQERSAEARAKRPDLPPQAAERAREAVTKKAPPAPVRTETPSRPAPTAKPAPRPAPKPAPTVRPTRPAPKPAPVPVVRPKPAPEPAPVVRPTPRPAPSSPVCR